MSVLAHFFLELSYFFMTHLLDIFMTTLVYPTYLNIIALLAFKYFTEKLKGSVSLCRFNNFKQFLMLYVHKCTIFLEGKNENINIT